MKKFFFRQICSISFFFLPLQAYTLAGNEASTQANTSSVEEGIIFFTPPLGWHLADAGVLPSHVKIMVVGKGPSAFPPSMNLSTEPYKGTLKQYLKVIKNMNDAQGYEWKDLGSIPTEAGKASLSQVDTKSQWGEVRLMHVILLKNNTIYILTASALKQDFPLFYKDFFAAMRSLRLAKDIYEMVINPQQRVQLRKAAEKLQDQWLVLLRQKQREMPGIALNEIKENAFKSEYFQSIVWKSFQEMLDQKHGDLSPEWRSVFLQKLEDDLFQANP